MLELEIPTRMRAAVITAPRTLEIREVDTPEPTADQVLIRVDGCGVCGSNLPKANWYRYSHASSQDAHLHVFQIDLHPYDDFPFSVPGERMSFTVFPGAAGCGNCTSLISSQISRM